MSVHFCPRSAAIRRRMNSFRIWLPVALAALTLPIQGCVDRTPQPFRGPDASDPAIRVPAAAYRSAVGGYTSQRPVEPAPWRERNDGVAPIPKPDGK